mmetsp:Transcript_27758/g.43322  ORF Transcript_27758/g.43322 Transcript_27758/m.43322 type:complete len:193 (-) Transcript_27758:600-1178(-)
MAWCQVPILGTGKVTPLLTRSEIAFRQDEIHLLELMLQFNRGVNVCPVHTDKAISVCVCIRVAIPSRRTVAGVRGNLLENLRAQKLQCSDKPLWQKALHERESTCGPAHLGAQARETWVYQLLGLNTVQQPRQQLQCKHPPFFLLSLSPFIRSRPGNPAPGTANPWGINLLTMLSPLGMMVGRHIDFSCVLR